MADFKTDAVVGNRLASLHTLYAPQLDQYAEVLELLEIEVVTYRLIFSEVKRSQPI